MDAITALGPDEETEKERLARLEREKEKELERLSAEYLKKKNSQKKDSESQKVIISQKAPEVKKAPETQEKSSFGKFKDLLKDPDRAAIFLDALGSSMSPDNPFAGVGGKMGAAALNKRATESSDRLDMLRLTNTLETGRESRAASTAARKLSEYKLEQARKPPEMVEIVDYNEKKYKIPQENLMAGMKILSEIKRNEKLNLLSDAEIAEMGEALPVMVNGKKMMVSGAHYKSVVEGGKILRDEKQKKADFESLEGLSLEQMTAPGKLTTFARVNPQAFTTWINRNSPESSTELTNSQYRQFADLKTELTHNALKVNNIDEQLVGSINGLNRRLQSSDMLLSIPDPDIIGGLLENRKAVTVELPAGVTADQVYEEAEERKITVSEILENLYKLQQQRKKNE